jgi:hypothetical protein
LESYFVLTAPFGRGSERRVNGIGSCGVRNEASFCGCFGGSLFALFFFAGCLRFLKIGHGPVVGPFGGTEIAHEQAHTDGFGFIDKQIGHGHIGVFLLGGGNAVIQEGALDRVAAL